MKKILSILLALALMLGAAALAVLKADSPSGAFWSASSRQTE